MTDPKPLPPLESPLAAIMRGRRTAKVLADPDAPPAPRGLSRDAIDRMLEAAGFAPFHYPANAAHLHEMRSRAPWRVYKLDGAGCRALLERLKRAQAEDGLEPGKILNMLAAAEALLQVVWLPEPAAAEGGLSLTDIEHVAAAGAAIQNLLLLATEAGLKSYWSSGGVLRAAPVTDWLGAPADQPLLGAVFLFPSDVGKATVAPGKLRDARGTVADWSVWREIDASEPK